jgi:hypothetical protein
VQQRLSRGVVSCRSQPTPTEVGLPKRADAVKISFLGVQVRMSLAVALLIAAIAGALLMAAAGTARITQLRMVMRRDRAPATTSLRTASRSA